ncbi:unnamed protein product, partial [Nesidiocoris tenuis]
MSKATYIKNRQQLPDNQLILKEASFIPAKNIEKFTIKILKFAQNEKTPHFRNVKNIHIFCK